MCSCGTLLRFQPRILVFLRHLSVASTSSTTSSRQQNNNATSKMYLEKLKNTGFKPVMVREMLSFLAPKPGQTILDCTFGCGFHTQAILDAVCPITVLALDRDPNAVELAEQMQQKTKAESSGRELISMHGKFSDLPELLASAGYGPNSIDGIVLHTGISYLQLQNQKLGHQLNDNDPLDLRMDDSHPDGVTAADVLNKLDELSLANILKRYGKEKESLKIARSVTEAKLLIGWISTVGQLKQVIQGTHKRHFVPVGNISRSKKRAFLALRMFVNDELNELAKAIEIAHWALKPETGRLVTIVRNVSEDKILKTMFSNASLELDDTDDDFILVEKARYAIELTESDVASKIKKNWTLVTRSVVTPSGSEFAESPLSLGCGLRLAIKTAN